MTNDELTQEVEGLKSARRAAANAITAMMELVETVAGNVTDLQESLQEKYKSLADCLSTLTDNQSSAFESTSDFVGKLIERDRDDRQKFDFLSGISRGHSATIQALVFSQLANGDLHRKGFDMILGQQADAFSSNLVGEEKEGFDMQIDRVRALEKQLS